MYVLNAGGAGNIAGFRLEHGRLSAIANSSRPLSGSAAGPAEISFDPSGRFLVVTEKNTNRLSTYAVDDERTRERPDDDRRERCHAVRVRVLAQRHADRLRGVRRRAERKRRVVVREQSQRNVET